MPTVSLAATIAFVDHHEHAETKPILRRELLLPTVGEDHVPYQAGSLAAPFVIVEGLPQHLGIGRSGKRFYECSSGFLSIEHLYYFYCVSSRGHEEEEAVSEGSEVETELGDKRGSVATT